MWGVQKKKGKRIHFFTHFGGISFFLSLHFFYRLHITLLREHTHTHTKRETRSIWQSTEIVVVVVKKNTATPKEVRKKGRRRRRRRSRDVLGAPFGVDSRWGFSSARDFGIAAPGLFSFCRVSSRLFAARAGANDVF